MLDRRNFLKSAASAAALGVSALPASAGPLAFSDHGDWRAYEIRTIVEIDSTEPTQVWVPAAVLCRSPLEPPARNQLDRKRLRGAGARSRLWRRDRQARMAQWERTPRRDRKPYRDARPRGGHPCGRRKSPRRSRATTRSLHQGDRAYPDRRDRQRNLRQNSGWRGERPSRRRRRSTPGLSQIRSASPRRAAAASGDVRAMLTGSPRLAANAPISTASLSASLARRVFPRATSTAFASPHRASATRAWRRFDRRHQGPALSRRRLARGHWLDADGRSRRPKGDAGGAADSSERGRAQSRRRA